LFGLNLSGLFRPYPVLKTGIINLHSGTSFRGVVYQVAGAFMVLRNAEMLQDRGQAARHVVDGEVIVRITDIDFIQVVG
jgi:small nuclear ribonucleoprotein (snRNP)-like protein